MPVIKRCPLLGGSLTKIVTFGTKHFFRYSRHVRYLGCPLLGGFTVQYIFRFKVLFLATFCTSFWERVHNSKKIVDLISTLTKYCCIIWRLYFIYRQFILFISTLPFLLFLYTISWRYKRDCLHASSYILFYIMFHTINTMRKH